MRAYQPHDPVGTKLFSLPSFGVASVAQLRVWCGETGISASLFGESSSLGNIGEWSTKLFIKSHLLTIQYTSSLGVGLLALHLNASQ